jgi:NADH-quinone oxidoreductase subunit G
MTVMTGHTSRRYRGNKRTFENQYLGPFVNHEMNRCITCYRCVRYYKDYAGGKDLQAFGSRSRMYFGREQDGTLENVFSGNLVEVCPTGVFTDKPFSQIYSRKWDLQSAPSICPGCSVGCNTMPGERYGRLKRVHNRYHGAVNGYFLCDRGRYGFGFVNDEKRIRQPGLRIEQDVFDAIEPDAGVQRLADIAGQTGVIGIGSPRASLEANYALKTLVGADNFCTGLSSTEGELISLILDIHQCGGARNPTLAEVEAADAVLVLGEDVLNTAPRVALAVRQSIRNKPLGLAEDAGIPLWQEAGVVSHAQAARSPLLVASVLPTQLDDIAVATYQATADGLAALGFAVAHGVDTSFAQAEGLDVAGMEFVQSVVTALSDAQRPLVICGTSLRHGNLIKAAANIAWALHGAGKDAALLLAPAEANSLGVGLLGGAMDLDSALQAAASGRSMIVLENDLFRRADRALVAAAFSGSAHTAVLDALEGPTAECASLVLPVATFAESTGTYVSYEGRAQRYFEVFAPAGDVAPAWRWLADAGVRVGRNEMRWRHVQDVVLAVSGEARLAGVARAAPDANYRNAAGSKVPRETHRYSGRTAMNAAVNIHEPKTPVDEETPFSYSMEGSNRDQPGALVPYVWAPGWNSNQSVHKFQQEVGGALAGGDPGVRLLDTPIAQVDFANRFRSPQRVPQPAEDDLFLLLPAPCIFGSEEQSGRSEPIIERGSGPFVVLSAHDADRLAVNDSMGVHCEALGVSLAVRVDSQLAAGVAAVSVGVGGLGDELPSVRVTLAVDPEYIAPTTDPRDSARVIARG